MTRNDQEHRAWIDALSGDDLLILYVPTGYRFKFLFASYIKRFLATDRIDDAERLYWLERLTDMVDNYFSAAMLATIKPMSDTELEMFHEAAALDRDKSRCDNAFDLLTEHVVFMSFCRLNPSIIQAIKLREFQREAA